MYVFSFTASTDNNIEIRNFPSGRKLVCGKPMQPLAATFIYYKLSWVSF